MVHSCIFKEYLNDDTLLVRSKKGNNIFMLDQRVSYLYHLHEGVVGIFEFTDDGSEILTSLYIPPSIIGLLAFTGMYSNRKIFHYADARALTDVVYCKVKREAVWDLIDSKEFRAKLFDLIYNIFIVSTRLTAASHRGDIRKRITNVLYILARGIGRQNADGSTTISGVSHEVISIIANTTRCTVTRVLQELKNEELIYIKRRKIIIPSINELISRSVLLTRFVEEPLFD